MEKSEKRIEIVKNGPYLVFGNIPLDKVFILPDVNYDRKVVNSKWGKTEKIKTNQTYSLCRCGASKTHPFCDGTHTKVNWNSKETADFDKILETSSIYESKNLIMHDKGELCFGAGFCHNKSGSIWEFIESKDTKYDKTIKQMSDDCPAGRFVLIDKKTNKVISPNFSPSISSIEEVRKSVSGPLWVKGNIEVISQDKKKSYEKRDSVTLCRCGKSNNTPFCDGQHAIDKWTDGDKSLKNE